MRANMKKILLALLLCVVGVQAQEKIPLLEKKRPSVGQAVNLDGSSEYMSKSSPSNLDLNGAERVTLAANRTFEDSLGMWIAVESATVSQSNTQKHAGTYSQKVITSGAWSGTQLPYANFTTLISGEKYTIEIWVYNESADSVKIVVGEKVRTVSIGATTWTKFVYNLQATSSTVNQNIQILWKTTGKTSYVDDFSVTQAYDALVSAWVKPTSKCYVGDYIANQVSLIFYSLTTDKRFQLSDGVTTVNFATPITYGRFNFVALRIDRVSNGVSYLDGTQATSNSIANIGKVNLTKFEIGKNTALSTYADGLIGETQITKFKDIAQSNVNASTLTQACKQGLGTWINGTIVGWWKFRGTTDSQMLRDYSNSANNLSGTNVTTADQERGAYPSK